MPIRILVLRAQKKFLKILRRDTNEISIKIYKSRGMRIGKGCRIFSDISTGEPYLICIGNHTTISTNVNLVTHDNSAIKVFSEGTDFVGQITIGDNCFIGTGAIILPGVIICNNTIVAAGSVVTKSVLTPGLIVGGNPAVKIGTISSLVSKHADKVFNFRGLDEVSKKNLILSNQQKWLIK